MEQATTEIRETRVLVEGKQMGRGRPLFPAREVFLPPVAGDVNAAGGVVGLTLRDFIAFVVRGEVRAYAERQEARQMVHALTAAQIADGAARGKIDSGGARESDPAAADPDAAVAHALQAFQDGLYFVFVDDAQKTSLDEELVFRQDSRVMFMRLVALAGG